MAWPINASHIFIALSIYMFFLDCKLPEIKFCNLTQKLAIEMILVSTLSHKCTSCNGRCWKLDGVITVLKQKSPASRPEIDPIWPHHSWPCFERKIGLNDLLNSPETWMLLWTSTTTFNCYFLSPGNKIAEKYNFCCNFSNA